MGYTGTLIAVADMAQSKRFYHDLLGMNVVADFGANVMLEGGLYLQTADTWTSFIGGKEITLRNNAGELYFEEDNIDLFLEKLRQSSVELIHEPTEHPWGQRVVRFYDPDGHIIEVGENIAMVVKRFDAEGMTAEQIAVRMDVPVSYVKEYLSHGNK